MEGSTRGIYNYTYEIKPETTTKYKIKIVEFNTCPDCGGTLKPSFVFTEIKPHEYEAICKECGAVFHSYFPIGKTECDFLTADIWKVKDGTTSDPLEGLASKIGELKAKLSDPSLTSKEKSKIEEKIARLEQWQD